jgi:hypothetical protein
VQYKVFATFEDPRLPAKYVGAGDDDRGEELMQGVAEGYSSLTPDQKETIAPFMLPPYAEESWVSHQVGQGAFPQGGPCPTCPGGVWSTISAAGDKVLIWWQNRYPQDEQRSQQVANELTQRIWPTLTEYMGREPLSDSGEPNNGGDGRLDVYLVDLVVNMGGGHAPYDLADRTATPCDASPGYVLLNRKASGQLLNSYAAHELMHAVHSAFDASEACLDLHWWAEASATWAEDLVYPQVNTEHSRTRAFSNPQRPLHSLGGYDAYVFPFYLTNKFGANTLRQVWENLAAMTWDQAVQAATPGLSEAWPEFGVSLWNRPPVDQLTTWDGIPHKVRPRTLESSSMFGSVTLGVTGASSREVPAEFNGLAPLSNQYYQFVFSDPEARFVRISNPHSEAPFVAAHLLRRVNGVWELERMDSAAGFCRDVPGEEIEEAVLILSNYHRSQVADHNTNALVTLQDGCGWYGDVSHESSTSYDRTVGGKHSVLSELVSSEAQGLQFLPAEADGALQRFETGPATLHWTVTGSSSVATGPNTVTCEWQGEGTIDLEAGAGELRFTGTAGSPQYELLVHGIPIVEVPRTCTNQQPTTQDVAIIWMESGSPRPAASDELTGEFSRTAGDASQSWQWVLTNTAWES